jgi:hypothetical protein
MKEVVACFKVLYQNLAGGADANHEILSHTRFEVALSDHEAAILSIRHWLSVFSFCVTKKVPDRAREKERILFLMLWRYCVSLMTKLYVISGEHETEMHQNNSVSVTETSRQNINTCQHWFNHSNFENEGPCDPTSPGFNSPPVRNCCGKRSDPFLPENRIPLPKFHYKKTGSNDHEGCGSSVNQGVFFYTMPSPTSGRRRNERERQRVRSVNEGFERLRQYLPIGLQCRDMSDCVEATANRARRSHKRRCSKVDVLRAAIVYIRHLQGLLDEL